VNLAEMQNVKKQDSYLQELQLDGQSYLQEEALEQLGEVKAAWGEERDRQRR
jgi:hypothetical protein